MSGRIKGVAFDLNGTLVDTVSFEAEAWVRAFRLNGYTVDPTVLPPLMGMATPKLIKTVVGNLNDQEVERIDYEYKNEFMKNLGKIEAFPDALRALEKLRKDDIKVAVASSSRFKVVEDILEKTGLIQYVDAFVGGDEVLLGKPDPEIYVEAFKRIKVSPRMGAVVGDTEYDALPARRIGALAILIRRDDVSVKSADLVMHSLTDAVIEIVNA